MSRMFLIPVDGDMRPMKTWNCWVGCRYECTYCNVRTTALTRLKNSHRYKDGFMPHLVEDELGRKFKSGDFVFIGYMGDISFAGRRTIIDLCCRISEQPKVKFLFCTKSPLHYWYWHINWPQNLYLGATIETNRNYGFSYAPLPVQRFEAMRAVVHTCKFVSIEPICDFDLEVLLQWMDGIKPEIVEIGCDNYHNSLPEPPWEKVEKLINGLKVICPTVVIKSGLERLKRGETCQEEGC